MRSSFLFKVIRKIYRKLIDFTEVFLRKFLEININRQHFYFLPKLHLHTVWIIATRDSEFTKFQNYINLYLKKMPKIILDFRMEACLSSKSRIDIEYYQSLILEQQQLHGFSATSARLISNNAFLANTNTHAYIDSYLKSRILAGLGYKNIFVCLDKKQRANVKNMAMLKYWERYITIIDPQKARRIFSSNLGIHTEDITWAINVNGKMTYIEDAKIIVEYEWKKKEAGRPLLQCDAELIDFGKKSMLEMGLPKDAWFVVLHIRDNGFQNGSWQKRNPWDDYRNADIETYRAGLEAISRMGGYVVRVGDPKMKPFEGVPNLIDYAHSRDRSTYLDTYLFATCKFFIGTTSGPILTAQLFGTPTLATNFAPVGYRMYTSNSITILKKFYSESLGRTLNLQETLNHTLSHETNGNRYPEHQITLIDNSVEEIASAIVEMNEIVDGYKVYSNYIEKLNQRADSLYELRNGYPALGRLGEKYLLNMENLAK